MYRVNFFVFLFALAFACTNAKKEEIIVLNPYEKVNWSTDNRYKANFHTHTSQSDGAHAPHEVIDAYHKAGYSILSLTDHSLITWPWDSLSFYDSTYENRYPEELNMLAVKGNELSGGHHRGNYFNVLAGEAANQMKSFDKITSMDGFAIINHPGRYWEIDKKYIPHSKFSPEWYLNYLRKYEAIIGIEVYNMADNRYPNDHIFYDQLLSELMPERLLWGYANDDMHHGSHMFHGYQYMIMPELTEDMLKTCMKEGAFIFISEPEGNGVSKAPVIDSIIVNQKKKNIVVYGQNFDSIKWISGITGANELRQNNIVGKENIFSYKTFSKPYVRVVLENEHGKTCSQPFGFKYLASLQIVEEKPAFLQIKEGVEMPKIEWVEIPSGAFIMGSPENEQSRINDEIQREVSISSFSISKYEITFEQYDLFCEATGRPKPDDENMGRGRRPVINVNWDDAFAFASWMGCRLPTEAEWEYACRAGTSSPYNTGECLREEDAVFNAAFPNGECPVGEPVKGTFPVGSFKPNTWGLYDMHGNVYEWCNDWSGDYLPGDQTDPVGPEKGSGKVYRGGSWLDWGRSCRSAYRSYDFTSFKSSSLGFRIVKNTSK